MVNLGDYNGTNSTGISWWPGDDVAMVQVYKVDHNPEVQMNEPITLMPSTLIDPNGNLLPLNFTLHKGLYNVVFVDQNNNTFRVMIELENDTPHTLNKADMVSVNIFPNPIDSNTGQMSTTLESLINCSFNYTIVDANNRLYHQDQGHLNANDQTELIIKTQNLPSGQLFHKFVFDDGSVKILQTLKD